MRMLHVTIPQLIAIKMNTKMSNEEKEIMKTNLKLSVFASFPYKRLREVCDKICELGFVCEFVSNGNIVFTDISKKKNDEHETNTNIKRALNEK
jgi:hypothetical protein